MQGFKTRVLVTLLIFWSSNTAFAQKFRHPIWPNDDKQKTLVNNESKLGSFGALSVNYSQADDATWVYLGAEAGIIINDYFILGLAGYGLASSITIKDTEVATSGELNVYGGYGGVMLGAKIAPKKVFHFNIPILLGIGNLEVSDNSYFLQGDPKFTIERSLFFVLEPRLEAEMNVTQKFRLGIGAGYRLINGTDLSYYDDQNLSMTTYQLSLKFGRY
jgi:hypothetical protein